MINSPPLAAPNSCQITARLCGVGGDRYFAFGFLDGSSFGSTYLKSSGPMAVTSTTVSPVAQAKWDMRGGAEKNPPGVSGWPLDLSSLSPIPTLNVPDNTVTFSTVLCQCGGIV